MKSLFKALMRILDNPWIWQLNRYLLNAGFGLYRRRFRVLRRWGVLGEDRSILDIGCGTGQYSWLPHRSYLGVDLNQRYIQHAMRNSRLNSKEFRNANANSLINEPGRFDFVLMVDFLHHLSNGECHQVLQTAEQMAIRHVVSFEPVKKQPNRIGQWLIDNDRGQYMRTLDELHQLFAGAGLQIQRSQPLRLGPLLTRAILCTGGAPAPVST